MKNLENLLRRTFLVFSKKLSIDSKKYIKGQVLDAYKEQYSIYQDSLFNWNSFLSKFYKVALSTAVFGMFFHFFIGTPQLLAGSVNPTGGIVKIVRGDKVLLINEETTLLKNDIIQLGYNGTAQLVFPDHFESTLFSRTEIKILGNDEIFIEKGRILNNAYSEQQFSADRGFVSSLPGSTFIIAISDSGEMEIIAQKQNVSVFDWKSGEMKLNEGEKLFLRTDTNLAEFTDIPSNISLSKTQIQSIKAKLIITRTKLLTTVEKITSGNKDQGTRDLASAKNSFLSLINIIKSSRNLEISKRIAIENFSFKDILTELSSKDLPRTIIDEAISIKNLYTLIDNNKNNISFLTEKTTENSFNRFVLLDRVFHGEKTKDSELLKNKYVVVFLRKILNEPLRIDQITILNNGINAIPKNELSKDFLTRLHPLLPPNLQELLIEKIERVY